MKLYLLPAPLLVFSAPAAWAVEATAQTLSLTTHNVGYAALAIFFLAYLLVMAEEFVPLRKSKPVILAAGVIWAMIAYVYTNAGITDTVEHAVRHNILELAELTLFLMVAMTYINAMEERLVFEALRTWLIRKGLSYRKLFWLTMGPAGYVSGAVAAGNPDSGCRRQHALHRFGGGRCPDGPGARNLYLLRSPEVDAGYRAWIRGEYCRPYVV